MNRLRNIKQVKFNENMTQSKTKSNFSTISLSNSTKLTSKLHLSEIFEYMDSEYPLSDLAELLEKETDGKFTQLTFREFLDQKYPDLIIADKLFLIKHIPLSKVGITPYSPFISLLYLFRFIQGITKQKIISPSLIFYSLADKLQFSQDMTTIDYFESLGLKPDIEIKMEEFYLNYGKKLGLDEMENIILFKSIDYNNDGKIKIEDLILVIDSYRNDNLNDKYLAGDISLQNDASLLKIFLEKNFLTLDLIYEKAEYNYMKYIDIKSFLVNEVYNYKRFLGKEDTNINETIIDNVLIAIKRKDKVFKNDLRNYLGEFIFNKEKNINELNDAINLNEKQKYWINKFIDIIHAVKSTPKMIFNLANKDSENNIVNIIELMRQAMRLFPSGKLTTKEMQQIINSLDINKTGLIEINQYEIIINIIQDIKDKIESKIENGITNIGNNKEKIINLWSKGIKKSYYHLLPAKGNYEILEKINQDIKNNIIFDEKENDINVNNIIEAPKKKIKKNNFLEQRITGDEGVLYEEIDEKTGKKEKFYSNDKDLIVNKVEVLNKYSDEDLLKIALENFNFEEIYFSKEELLNHLANNNIEKKMAEETVKYLDNNENGQISVINLFKFLLYELKYKSSKLVLKYLYLKIHKDLKYNSSTTFFKNNKFNPQKRIKLKKLCTFLESFYIDTPLTKKLNDILEYLFKPPILIVHLCQLIDDYKNNSINGEQKTYNIINNISFNKNLFDKEIKKIVMNLIEVDEFNNSDIIRCKNLSDKINEMLSDYSENMTYTQFAEGFSKKIDLSTQTQDALFYILKHFPKNGEKQPLISKSDLITFLLSYSCGTDKSNNIIFNQKDEKEENDTSEEREGLSISQMKNIIEKLEENYPPLKYAFEAIPFRINGLISSSELFYIMNSFYNNGIPKKILMDIIFCIDEKKEGIISFSKLQLFLNNFSEDINFSPLLEIEIIANKLYENNILNVMKYFKKFKIEDFEEIKFNDHKKIMKNLCSNSQNIEKLFNYLKEESNNNYYNIKNLVDKIDFFLKEKNEELILEQNEINKKEEEDEEEKDLGLPDIPAVEESLKLINIGPKGFISIYELLMKMKKGYRKYFSEIIDKNKIGYISFPDFIKICRKIYGTEINLNYKLCAQYLYKAYIFSPKQIKNFILNKCNQKNINNYLDKNDIYNNFMFAFCNDKFLFDNFYNVYCEKKGKYKNKINLNSLLLFIYSNNPELKPYENNLRFSSDNKEKIDLSNKNKKINEILEKKLTNVREIIEKMNFKSSKLQKNFSVSENYIKSLLETHFNFDEDDAEELCNFFRMEEGKFNIKQFFEFDLNNIRNINIILEDDIIPRIQSHISKSIYKSYKDYKNNIFKSDYLDICELYLLFNKLYKLSLYHCLVIIYGNKEQFLSIDKFFKETNLKNSFPSKELEPALLLAIIRLNEFIEEKYKDNKNDKLKIFKGFDTNKDGILSTEEFFNALNEIEGLELNESQKHKLYNFADTNKDGKINAKEFLNLIKNIKNYINEEEEMNAALPASFNSNQIAEKKFIPKILEKDITGIKANYKFNIKKIKKLKKNHFLSYLVSLQLDLIDNYYSFECMENDFLSADKEEKGFVNGKTFKIILRKKIVNIDDKNINLFIKFSEDNSKKNNKKEENEDEEEEEDDSKSDINKDDLKNKKINYKIFLNRLANYKIKDTKTE